MIIKEAVQFKMDIEDIRVGDIMKVEDKYFMITFYYYKKGGQHYTAYGYVDLKTGENKGGYDTIPELLEFFDYPEVYKAENCETNLPAPITYK